MIACEGEGAREGPAEDGPCLTTKVSMRRRGCKGTSYIGRGLALVRTQIHVDKSSSRGKAVEWGGRVLGCGRGRS